MRGLVVALKEEYGGKAGPGRGRRGDGNMEGGRERKGRSYLSRVVGP